MTSTAVLFHAPVHVKKVERKQEILGTFRCKLFSVRACSEKVDPSPRASRVLLPPRNYWANPERLVLTPRHEGIYTIDRSYIFLSFCDVGARCTVIVKPPLDASKRPELLLYSPLPIDNAIRKELDKLGDVSVVIAPNNEHVDFVASAAAAYPNATILGPTGCKARWPNLPFDSDTFADDGKTPHPALASFSEVVTAMFVPSAPFFNETVLIHKVSRTFIVCDLWWNWPSLKDTQPKGVELPYPTRAFAFAMNRIYLPFYNRILVQDREAFALFMRELLDTKFKNIIPCHGNCVAEEGWRRVDRFFPSFLKAL